MSTMLHGAGAGSSNSHVGWFATAPYAGIIQVRFNGYDLRLPRNALRETTPRLARRLHDRAEAVKVAAR